MNPRGTKKRSRKCKKLNDELEALDAVFPREVCAGFLSMERKREDRRCSVGTSCPNGFFCRPEDFLPSQKFAESLRYYDRVGFSQNWQNRRLFLGCWVPLKIDTIATSAIRVRIVQQECDRAMKLKKIVGFFGAYWVSQIQYDRNFCLWIPLKKCLIWRKKWQNRRLF